jgi:beta-phosphoglucomutase-like phosphatase (HAD superfamily)
MALEGVILDVDGTLVLSNDAHANAWVQAFTDLSPLTTPKHQSQTPLGTWHNRNTIEAVARHTWRLSGSLLGFNEAADRMKSKDLAPSVENNSKWTVQF